MKKAIAILLSAVLAASLLTGCGDKKETPSSSSGTGGAAVSSTYLTVDGKAILVPYVAKVDGEEVSLDNLRYYFLNLKANINASGELTADQETQLMEDAMAYVKDDIAIKRLAEKNGVSLTDEEKKEVADNIEKNKQQYESEAEYAKALEKQYMTPDFYASMQELGMIRNKLLEKLFDKGGAYEMNEETVKQQVNSSFVHAKHILVQSTTENYEARAKEALEKVQAGEDFDALVKEYGDDPGMEAQPEGYYFTRGQMVQEFEDAAYALEVGQTSGLVKTSYGYHIIQRLPIDEEYVTENLETLTSSCKQAKFDELLDELVQGFEVHKSDKYDLINSKTLK